MRDQQTTRTEPTEPTEWSSSPCPITPDACWTDDATGEHVDAYTGARTTEHPIDLDAADQDAIARMDDEGAAR